MALHVVRNTLLTIFRNQINTLLCFRGELFVLLRDLLEVRTDIDQALLQVPRVLGGPTVPVFEDLHLLISDDLL